MSRNSVRGGYWLAFGIAVVLFMLSRTDKGQAVLNSAADSIGSAVRGIRNNNPGNIKHGSDWQGLRATQTDETFAQFETMPYGIRALAITLRNYQRLYGINTVRKAIMRWSATDQAVYVANVADYLGVERDAVINLSARATMFAMIRAIVRQEVGTVAALLVTDGDINAGLDLAGGFA